MGTPLGENLRYYYDLKLTEKYREYFTSICQQEHNTEIDKLTKKGISICKRYFSDYHDNNIYDEKNHHWRERYDRERIYWVKD